MKRKLGAVAQACNPSDLGDGDKEDHHLRTNWVNKQGDPIPTDGWAW
jgi:hypothetical protein